MRKPVSLKHIHTWTEIPVDMIPCPCCGKDPGFQFSSKKELNESKWNGTLYIGKNKFRFYIKGTEEKAFPRYAICLHCGEATALPRLRKGQDYRKRIQKAFQQAQTSQRRARIAIQDITRE